MYGLFSSSTCRSVASQFCGAFPYYCLSLAYGATIGFHIIFIAELYKDNSEITTTVDQLSWFAGLDILSPLGQLITGTLTQRFGSQFVALATTTLFFVPFLLYYFSNVATTVLIGRAIFSLTATTTLVPTYISEISEPRVRGIFLVFSQVTIALGGFYALLLGNFLQWRTIALANLVFPVFAAVIILFTPNSPSWLASKGRIEDAEKSLCWLRGWAPANQVQIELSTIIENHDKSALDEHNLDVECTSRQERIRQFFRLFFERSFYLPLGTMCLIFFVYPLSGTATIVSYAAVIFSKLDSPIEPSLASAILGFTSLFGVVIIIVFTRRFGKRKMVFISVIIVILCHASVAIVGFLKLQGNYLWIPMIAVITAIQADGSGVGPVIFMLVSEIFPSSGRYIGASIALSFNEIWSSVMKKSYLYIVDAITLPGVFLLFALVNIIALIIYYFVIPETEGKSLEEIEDHYRGVKKLDMRTQ